ncbi:MAG: monofunctional biosynthetic peptidoglycan transglycosylase [Rhizobiales bacterium]|nr:monofunctional biosynthetic peptidoglycan transglycosylase [Hyphomicrobiales bacterium]
MNSAPSRFRPRGHVFRVLRLLATVLLVLLLLPYLIAPLYRFVDPVSMPMLWRWATGQRVERMVMPLNRISPALPRAVISAEDGSFCTHHGIDWRGIREAFNDADDVFEMRGGSTITQQVVKNLFFWQGRSYIRKALELPLAVWVDLVLPKRRMLEIYLNIAQWGPTGQFGAEAGARYAFGKSARQLTAREAALMAAILPSPRGRSARAPSGTVRRLAAIYEARAARFAARTACLKPPGSLNGGSPTRGVAVQKSRHSRGELRNRDTRVAVQKSASFSRRIRHADFWTKATLDSKSC